MAKGNDYFALIGKQASYCVQAAEILAEFFCDYSAATLADRREKMHEIEHKADEMQHDILEKLSTEFITPIEQEDITHLVQIIDDVTDALDDVLLECYMYHVETLPEGAKKFSEHVLDCVKALYDAVMELKSFKKPARLRPMLVVVNSMESKADDDYNEFMHALFGSTGDVRTLLGGKAIFDGMEACCDQCEHAADVIDQIIMKNA